MVALGIRLYLGLQKDLGMRFFFGESKVRERLYLAIMAALHFWVGVIVVVSLFCPIRCKVSLVSENFCEISNKMKSSRDHVFALFSRARGELGLPEVPLDMSEDRYVINYSVLGQNVAYWNHSHPIVLTND